MHSAFNPLFFPNSMFTLFFSFDESAMCSLQKYHSKTIIIITNNCVGQRSFKLIDKQSVMMVVSFSTGV